MRSDRRAAVAIVGAGFSGTMVAAHLARRGIPSILIEPRDAAGQGTAFSTRDPAHLLNVPAGNMSAWPERPDDFSDRAGSRECFAERRLFGSYLREILGEALENGASVVPDRAVAATREGSSWTLALEGGGRVEADALVLAIGNQLPAGLPQSKGAGDRLISDPWGPQARAAIEDSAAQNLDILILGTGLTMVDVVLSLHSAGHQGRILALSRRGLAPRSHSHADPAPVEYEDVPSGSARALTSWLRSRSREVGWRAAGRHDAGEAGWGGTAGDCRRAAHGRVTQSGPYRRPVPPPRKRKQRNLLRGLHLQLHRAAPRSPPHPRPSAPPTARRRTRRAGRARDWPHGRRFLACRG